MAIAWQREGPDGLLWSATIGNAQGGWFEVEVGSCPDGWAWVVNHDAAFRGCESTLEGAKDAVATQLERTGSPLPSCVIRPFTKEEGGGYIITFSDFPGVVASGATAEEAIAHGRGALEVFHRRMAEP
jgi:hypothetical protein